MFGKIVLHDLYNLIDARSELPELSDKPHADSRVNSEDIYTDVKRAESYSLPGRIFQSQLVRGGVRHGSPREFIGWKSRYRMAYTAIKISLAAECTDIF